jgi:hypothetical protein
MEQGLGERRRRLIEQAEGRVVEIGAGTGLNFRHHRLVRGRRHPNRDSWSAIQGAGFKEDDVDRSDLPGVPFLRPAVSGVVRAP